MLSRFRCVFVVDAAVDVQVAVVALLLVFLIVRVVFNCVPVVSAVAAAALLLLMFCVRAFVCVGAPCSRGWRAPLSGWGGG